MNKGDSFAVLDHGYVRVTDWMGNDERFVEVARASTGGGFVSWEPYAGHPQGDQGLLDFLYRKHHTSPFEMGELAIEVKAPLFVFREWHRHRTQSYNELSARYTQMPNEHYVPGVERFVMQSHTNKQGSAVEPLDIALATRLQGEMFASQQEIYDEYEEYLQAGLVREVARVNTPVSRYSVCYCKTDIWNWLHFLMRRLPPDAQFEIRQYAEAVRSILRELFPRTLALFEEYTLYGANLSRTDRRVLKAFIEKMQAASHPFGGFTFDFAGVASEHGIKGKKFAELLAKVLTEDIVA